MPEADYGSMWLTSDEYQFAKSLSPALDCDAILSALELEADAIASLPTKDPRRQLLEALRWRRRCLPAAGYVERDRAEGITYWLALQGGCPLSA